MPTSTMFRITDKSPIRVVTEKVVHDIVGRDDVNGNYAIRLGCDEPMRWIDSKNLEGFLDTNLFIKKQALDAGALVTPAIISRKDNVNIDVYENFCNLYMEDTRNKKSPGWDGHWFFQGLAMHVMDKLLCRAKMRDNNIYYLVEWGDRFKMKPSWIVREELLYYIKVTCLAWHQFDASWDVIDTRKMSNKEKEQMEWDRETFVATRTLERDDIDTYLLGENWEPMPVYDSDGHFCVDKDDDTNDAGDAEDADDAETADTGSYN